MKVKFDEKESNFIKHYVPGHLLNDKKEVINAIKKNYDFDVEVKPKWFDTVKELEDTIAYYEKEDEQARTVIRKLNQISDKDWLKIVNSL